MACSLPSRRFLGALALLPAATLGFACGQAQALGASNSSQATATVAATATAAAATPSGAPVQPARFNPATSGTVTSLAPLVDSVKGSVVYVEVQARPKRMSGMQGLPPGFAERFGMPPGMQGNPQPRQGLGSGFIIDATGTVLTNNHVVEGADAVRVKLEDGRSFDAEVLGRDPLTDVALLKLKGAPNNLPFVPLGDSDAVRVGDAVMAIGNPFGLDSSVSAGILSARARDIHSGPYDDFLQTDAAINPGNSGGPLFNMKGEVVGMNTAIIGGASGIGFAVPSNLIRALLPQLQETGAVRRGYLGLAIQDLTPELARALKVDAAKGAVVSGISRGGPGDRAGLKEEDIITSVGGRAVESAGTLTRAVALLKPDSRVKVELVRGGKPLSLEVTLGTRPAQRGEEEVTPRNFTAPATRKLGISLRDAEGGGAQIMEVEPGSPAERAGLMPGMVLVQVGDDKVSSASDAANTLSSVKSGAALLLRVRAPDSESTVLRALEIP
ncbi:MULTISPECIES: Do family serine endopeptidase [Myxococcus]|uniref:Do family serine endopeptidase n=1 Tax=Myxococcus llanfairpwllgwyngyllgogerychwyrndrobwllllantysiliogogogochensis TaxID=2590453 RepID=A0A540WP97_9BACT|nr:MULTISPECIES: Do family serine endopeptidase [Myxococcus]NTX06218.1 Do family serine endopeptidase [Myxococcus sp. CA040A]NTX34845.1 Do family serine endopeptidase [Myxococcus sp. CA033]TQF10816.1 Do family serine endopeptidase [Myxococcus llanfairpwllgwyngyllgogerychwyrndrobwllllantysiliogogogochensis]